MQGGDTGRSLPDVPVDTPRPLGQTGPLVPHFAHRVDDQLGHQLRLQGKVCLLWARAP
jgi:hypothetical protein